MKKVLIAFLMLTVVSCSRSFVRIDNIPQNKSVVYFYTNASDNPSVWFSLDNVIYSISKTKDMNQFTCLKNMNSDYAAFLQKQGTLVMGAGVNYGDLFLQSEEGKKYKEHPCYPNKSLENKSTSVVQSGEYAPLILESGDYYFVVQSTHMNMMGGQGTAYISNAEYSLKLEPQKSYFLLLNGGKDSKVQIINVDENKVQLEAKTLKRSYLYHGDE